MFVTNRRRKTINLIISGLRAASVEKKTIKKKRDREK